MIHLNKKQGATKTHVKNMKCSSKNSLSQKHTVRDGEQTLSMQRLYKKDTLMKTLSLYIVQII